MRRAKTSHGEPLTRPDGVARARLVGLCLVLAGLLGCDDISVVASNVEMVTVSPAALQIRAGGSGQLTASLTGPDGVALTGRRIEWASNDPTVALVDGSGTVAGIAAGQTNVVATADGVSGSALITVLPENALELDRMSVVFSAQPSSGTSGPVNVMVTPSAGQQVTGLDVVITYSGGPEGWLTASLSSEVAPAVLTLTADGDAMSPGTYTALVDVVAQDAPSVRLTATLVVSSRAPSILLGRTEVALTAPQGVSPAAQEVAVLNGGDGSVTGLTSSLSYPPSEPAGWLTATLLGSVAPTALRLVSNTAGLPEGTYSAAVQISSPDAENSPQQIDVTLTVAPPGPLIGVAPAELFFDVVRNTAPPASATFQVTNIGSDALTGVSMRVSYTAGEPSGWLSATPNGSTAPVVATVRPTNTGLAVGTYRAAVDVLSPVARNSPEVVTVTYTVLEPPALELDSTSLLFQAVEDGGDPAPRLVRVSNAGGTVLDSLRVGSVTYAGGSSGWLGVSLDTAAAPAFLTVAPSASGLAAGSHQAVVQVVADDGGVVNSPATVTVVLDVEARPQADLAVTVSDGVTSVVQGQDLTYTITVQNGGPNDVVGAVVTDTFPANLSGVTWTCAAGAQSSCEIASGTGDLDQTLDIAVGQSAVITATGTVGGSGTLVNRAHARTPAGVEDPNAANDVGTDDDTQILLPVDVSVTKTDSTDAALEGETLVYRVVVTNAGPNSVPGVVVIDTLPADLGSVSVSCAGLSGGVCANAGSGNTLGTADLPPGGQVIYTVTGVATAPGQLVNTAWIAVPNGFIDTDGSNDSASDTTTVTPAANIGIAMTDSLAGAVVGDTLTYWITVSNPGPGAANGARVISTVPVQLFDLGWSCVGTLGGVCSTPGVGTIDENVDLPVGSSVVFTARGVALVAGEVSKTAQVTSPVGTVDPDLGDNVSTDVTNILN